MEIKFADRMSRLGTESAFEVLAKAKELERQGKEIIHLQIGEPDFPTPSNIKEAAKKALDEDKTHYAPSAGIFELREAIADYISKTRGIKVLPEEVVVAPGGKPIIFLTLLSLLQEGDEVLYPNPGYPTYESVINFTGAKAVPVPLLEEFDFRFDVSKLEDYITDKTKMIILNSPQNPTGGILTKQDLKTISDLAKKYNLLIFSDEIYSRIIYEGKFESIMSIDQETKERTIMLDGYSKTYAMTGWRLGYGVMNKKLAEAVTKMMINSNSSTTTFAQYAGIEALQGPQDEVDKMVAEFKKRRDIIVDGLNAIDGVSCKKPNGAFYVFANIKSFNKPAKEIADYLLNEAGVAVLAGTDFGKFGEGYIRLSYANSVENIKKALEKIKTALEKLKVKA